jgi:hypothetical protein
MEPFGKGANPLSVVVYLVAVHRVLFPVYRVLCSHSIVLLFQETMRLRNRGPFLAQLRTH